MTWWVMLLAFKPDDPSSIPETHVVESKKGLQKVAI